MTQELYQEAMSFAGEKHSEQLVPGTTSNYLLHISNVAMEVLIAYNYAKDFDIDFAIQIAILHDTLEDIRLNQDPQACLCPQFVGLLGEGLHGFHVGVQFVI